jgi:Glycosyl transferase family 2
MQETIRPAINEATVARRSVLAASDRKSVLPGDHGCEADVAIFGRGGQAVRLHEMYAGQAAFLVCSGPSLADHDLGRLNERGILTMAVNNAASLVRPNLWVSVDDPRNFLEAIWRDPGILKFVPFANLKRHFHVRRADGQFASSRERVCDMPAVFSYCRNGNFRADQFLSERTFNWGNDQRRTDAYGNRGCRSVMLVSLRMLFYLGVRRVYLLGCDFRMEVSKRNYAFPQHQSTESIEGNNRTYRALDQRLNDLRPRFEKEQFHVFNCTANSGLTAFPFLPYDAAIADATKTFPTSLDASGMYDWRQRKGSAAKAKHQHRAEPATACQRGPDRDGHKQNSPRTLEIVSHCWKYSRLLSYQLSSLVLRPPKKVAVTMTVFYAPTDKETHSVLKYFQSHSVANVRWHWKQLEECRLFRRAIGRNIAALATQSDWIWFCDCDQVFGAGCLDGLADELARAPTDFVYPQCVLFSPKQFAKGTLLSKAAAPQVRELNASGFRPVQFNRAVGGLQILRGAIARRIGYCRHSRRFMRPADRWMRTFDDVEFRRVVGREGSPISVPQLYRIEHAAKGRMCKDIDL